MEEHHIWPRGGKEITIEELVPQSFLGGNLMAFQLARGAWCPAQTVKLKHSAEHLDHDLRRQFDPKRTSNAIASEVAIFRLAFHIHCVWIWENIGL